MEDSDDDAALSKLLKALALGARSVHGLPLGDEFEYESSFPEFSQLLQRCNSSLDSALSFLKEPDFVRWESCADACDSLIEQSQAYLERDEASVEALQEFGSRARKEARGSFGIMIENLDADMTKPQQQYKLRVDNSRMQPFIPNITQKYFSVTDLDLSFVDGHGFDTRFGELKQASKLHSNVIAPPHHVLHPYRGEIESLEYTRWQQEAPKRKPTINRLHELQATWIDTVDQLSKLATELNAEKEIAIDLEAHSYRSFSGMTCLMQISFGTDRNYLVDTLKLWHDLESHLGPVFANPNIVKVMHGADSDVQWLQRDFGIYIVNLFDTGRASRLLRYSSAGLSYLLKMFVGIHDDDNTKKKFQLSDWRRRPLPRDMQQYAIMDTHYLLDIYHTLLYELQSHSSPDVSIKAVLDISKQVCLIRYDKEPFWPRGYRSLIRRSSGRKQTTTTSLTELQQAILKELYDWRDLTARRLDESIPFVCSNQALVRLAMACPTSVSMLQACLNPMPPVILKHSQEICNIVKKVKSDDEKKTSERDLPLNAYFKPANQDGESRSSTGILSPVLGTETLFKQAGWMTPQLGVENAVVTTTDDEDGQDPTKSKPKHGLMVNNANKEYRSDKNTKHTLEMGKGRDQLDVADGLGAARQVDQEGKSLREQSERAQAEATRIRTVMQEDHKEDSTPTSTFPTERPTSNEEEEQEEDVASDNEEEFEIPKSLSEIYKISNRNRRKKKSTPPPTHREVKLTPPKDVDTIEGAEALLATASAGGSSYFDVKRQRTSDMEFMQQIGWVKSQKEAQDVLLAPSDESENEEPKEARTSFDYSKVNPAMGVFPSSAPVANPFFAGAAVAGTKNSGTFKGGKKHHQSTKTYPRQQGKQAERFEKKDGKSFAYRKR